MSEIEFELKSVEEKPARKNRGRSKYDPILDEFLDMDADLVEVDVEGREGNYVRVQLKNRIEARGLEGELDASVVNSVCYLEKI